MAANVEEYILKLGLQVSGGADTALAQLERRIVAEQTALTGLGNAAAAARAKLAELQASGASSKAAGIEKQSQAVNNLAGDLDLVKRQIESIAAAGNGGDVGALSKFKTQAADLNAKLSEAKAKLDAMNAAGHGNAGAQTAQRAKIAGLEDRQGAGAANVDSLKAALPKIKAAESAAGVERLRESMRKLDGAAKSAGASGKAIKETSPSFKQLGAAAAETDGPLGNFVRTIGKFKAAGAAGAALAVVGVIIAIATAAIAGAIALTRFALAMADAARSSRLLSGAAAGSAAGGAELEAVINDVANKSPLARDKIAEMARAMEVAHLAGRNMQVTLEAAATASSAIGDSAGAALTSIAEASQKARRFMLSRNDFTGVSAELEGTGVAFADVAKALATAQGVSVERAAQLIKAGQVTVKAGLEAMNAAVQEKFGKTVAAQMLSIGTQFAKLKETIGRLFDGVDIEPFLRGLKTITDLFREDSVTGAALHTLFISLFNPLAEASESIFPVISAFLRGMVIAVLTAYIGFLRVKAAINEAFGGDTTSKIDWIETAMTVGKYAVYALGAALFAIAAIVLFLIVAIAPLAILLSLPFLIAAAAVYLLIQAFTWVTTTLNDAIVGGFQAAKDYLQNTSWADIGMDLVRGLAAGIGSGASLVIEAVTNLGKSAMTTLKGVLGIHSPSTVFRMYGINTAEGFGQGVDAGANNANESVKQLGAVAPTPPAKEREQRGGNTYIFNYNAMTRDRFRAALADAIEQLDIEGPEPIT